MNTTISIVFIIILLIVAILRNIDWRSLALKWVGNNPRNAQIYIEAGDTIHTVEGTRIMMAAEGQCYIYKDTDNIDYIVDLPPDYPYKYIRGRRIIGLSDGSLVANPLGFFRREQLALINEGLTETSELLKGNTLIKAIHSMQSNKMKNMLIWIVVAAIAVGGYMYYRNMNKEEIPISSNISQNITVEQTAGIITPVPVPNYNVTGTPEVTIP